MLFVSLAVALGSISLFNPFVSSAPLSNLDVSLASSLAKSSHCSQVISNSSAAMSSTSLGQVNGFTGQDLSRRFVIPYALPPTGSRRFQDPVPMSHFPTFPQVYDASKLPPPCPQDSNLLINSVNEDCLYMTIYTPPIPEPCQLMPVIVWVHGGSFTSGSTTQSGLDASSFATKHNVVVVTLQYRLGLLGFLTSPEINVPGNFGLKDIITALHLVQKDIGSFGGEKSQVLLAGQSSGAEMIRSLLSTPSASGLFSNVALHSAPMNFGDHSRQTATQIGKIAINLLSSPTLALLQSIPVTSILDAQATLTDFDTLKSLLGMSNLSPIGEYFRPTVEAGQHDFSYHVRRHAPLPVTVPMLFTTVQNEACAKINDLFPDPVPNAAFDPIVGYIFGGSRGSQLIKSNLYTPESSLSDSRNALEKLGSDYVWTCPMQQSAVNISRANDFSTPTFIAQFKLGISYSNNTRPLCQGKVAHQDDIYALFGTSPTKMTPAQVILVDEIQSRWVAFAATSSPNTPELKRWNPISQNRLNLLVFGSNGAGRSPTGARSCESKASLLLGRIIPFDAQL